MKTILDKPGWSRLGLWIVALLGISPTAPAQTASTNMLTGSISVPGERDVFTFNLTNRTTFYFDALSNVSTLNWTLDGPVGNVVSRRGFTSSDGNSVGSAGQRLNPGFYRLTVDCDGAATNNYAFRFVDLTSAALLTPGTLVSNALALANETDLYQFTSAAGDRLFFDRQTLGSSMSVYWRLLDPYANEVFANGFSDVTITQRVAGTYTLLVEGNIGSSAAGGYSFVVTPQGNTPPPPLLGPAITLGAVVSGSQTNASTNFYTLNLATTTRILVDTLTNSSGTSLLLTGPAGTLINNVALNAVDGSSALPVLELVSGDYQLMVRRTSAGTVPFSFRLLNVATATPFVPSTPISGNYTPTPETDLFQFTNVAGARYYFDAAATNGMSNSRWRIYDPYNNLVGSGYYYQELAAQSFPLPGTYTLAVDGYYDTDSGPNGYWFNLRPVADGIQALSLGALTTGSIQTPGQRQQYLFNLASPTRLVFDSRTNTSQLRWSLDGPGGNLVNNRTFQSSDSHYLSPFVDLPAGDFTLTVFGTADATGGFSFRFFDPATAIPLTPGLPVSATLNPANETDAYRFTVAPGTEYYFDVISWSGLGNAYWRCVDALGTTVFAGYLSSDNAGRQRLSLGGTYTLLVEGSHNDSGSGSYTINVIPVADGLANFTLGSLVAGTIASPGQKQVYTFNLPSAAVVSFDSRTNSNTLRWSLDGPAGNLVLNRTFNNSDWSVNSVMNLAAGNYTLTVTGNGDATGGFAFRLFDLASAPPITPGTVVSNILAPANAAVAYRFTAAPGTKVFFDMLSQTSIPNVRWRCLDSSGTEVLNAYLQDTGPILLTQGGLYTLLIEGYPSEAAPSGTYAFNVVPVTDGQQSLTLGSVISGAVSHPGQDQRYTFTLPAAARIYFDSQTNNNNLRWTLTGPFHSPVVNRSFISSDGPNLGEPVLSFSAGDYTLTVNGSGDSVGGYRFRLFDLATATHFTPGITVGNTLNPANETDAYRFTANAGDRFFFDWISDTGLANTYWRLYDPHGNRLFNTYVTDMGTNTLPATGTYTVLVEGYYANTGSGSYQFDVSPRGNLPPPTLPGTALALDSVVTGSLATAATTNNFVFTLTNPATLLFDSLVNAAFTWTLTGPAGVMVANRSFQGSDSADLTPAALELPAGLHQVSVYGLAGNYSFRLLDTANAASFSVGTMVTGLVANTKSTVLHRFTGGAGERYYLDGQPTAGFIQTPYLRLLSPAGEQLALQPVSSDKDVFALPRSGSYTISVEGRYMDTGTNGTYAFRLSSVADATNAFVVGQTVAGNIAQPGQTQVHQFTLLNPAVLFFDSLTNNGLTWTLRGRNGAIVSRTFNGSDSADAVARLALLADNYEIVVTASGNTTDGYAFRLLDTASAVAFTPGTLVNGALTPGISTALYRFNATAGERFYYDGLPLSGFTATPYVRCYSPLANSLFITAVSSDVQVFTAPQTGTYLLAIEGRYSDTSTNGNFGFNLQPVVDFTNSFTLGNTISNLIAVPGQRQFHPFTLATATRVFIDSLTNSSLQWTLTGPTGLIATRTFNGTDSVDNFSVFDLPAGDYLITVDGSSATIGGYAFRLLDAASASPLTFSVTNTVTLAPGISTALRSFPGNVGDRFYLDGIGQSGLAATPYLSIIAPLGNRIVGPLSISSDFSFTNTQAGTFVLAVEGRYSDTSPSGTVSFRLVPNPSQPPQPLFDTNVAPDLLVSGVTLNPPSGLQSGASVAVAWTTVNNGSAATAGSFTERVTIRNTGTSQIIATGTLLYDESLGGPLAPTSTRPRALVLNLPDGPASVGTLEVTVTTDYLNNLFEQNVGGTGEANNATTINTSATLAPYPDLRVLSLQTTPIDAWTTNSLVTVSWVLTNSGNRATLGAWTESLIVRNTNTTHVIAAVTTNYDAALPELGDIPPAGSRGRSLSFTMPANSDAFGAFEVTVTTDSLNNLFEHNAANSAETNNSASLLSYSSADLRVTGLTATGNPSLQAGNDLVIQWAITNQGNVAATEFFYDRIVVRNTNTAEILLNTHLAYNPGQVGNGSITPGTSRPRQYTFALPDGTSAVGPLEVTISADTFNYLPEHNAAGTGEANNNAAVVVTVAGIPYPDLVVTAVSGPASGLPGQSVPLVWTIQNSGTVPATGSWSDQLFLSSDAIIGSDQYLTAVSFTGTLNPGASLTRTQLVTLPAFGVGALRPVVKTDAGSQLFEENDNNNSGISANPINLPAALTLSLSPATVSENAGSQASLATLTRNEASAQPLFVTLSNSRPDKVTAPVSVTIAGGASAASFYLGTIDDGLAGSNVVATISAQATNTIGATNILTVLENDTAALGLTLSAASVLENAPTGSLTATLTRNANLNQTLVVTLSSDQPAALRVPGSVTFSSGQTNLTFVVTNINDTAVNGARTVSIYASAAGFSSVARTINVLDDDTVSITLQLSSTNVSEAILNPAARATITRSPVSPDLLRIRLNTNGGSGLQIPAEVYIPAGQPGVEFNVNVVDDVLAYGSRTVQIIALAETSAGLAIPGAAATNAITIQEDDGPTLFVTVPVGVISESGSTSIAIMRNTLPTNALVVNLNLTPANQATIPATITFLPGVITTNFTLSGNTDGVSDGAQEVVIGATAAGYNSGLGAITVSDIDVPDLAPFSLLAETNALTDSVLSVVWAVTNTGLATATGSWVDEVYLATDSRGANIIGLVASVTNSTAVPIEDSYTLARTYLAPAVPGTYWFVLRVDSRNSQNEGSERNNSIISAPIVIEPAYRATVATDTNTALSGSPITLYGHTYHSLGGTNAPFRPATVRINKGAFRRTIAVLSDASGNFTTVFQPIPGEAGVYTVGADHPTVRQDPVQDQFTLLGMAAVPWTLTLRLAPDVPVINTITLANQSPLPLTGLTFGSEGLPLGFNLNFAGTNYLAGNEAITLAYELATSLTTPMQGTFNLLVTSQEGAVTRIPVNFTLAPPTAQLAAQPATLNRDMLRGEQTLVSVQLLNQGGVASGDMTVALPVVPWLSLVSPSTIPSLAPGAQTTLVFSLTPATNLPLTLYSGNIALMGSNASLSVPFNFRAVSEARGDLKFTFTDEFTYYANGAPRVTNATITLRDPITSQVVTNGSSDANGEVLFLNLPEGNYNLEASAPQHSLVRGGIRVLPGVTTEQEVFLTRETVRYSWTVVPTQIQDHYRVTLQPVFETELPTPELVVENPIVMPLVFPGQTSQFEIRLRNPGLIALQRVRVPVPNHPSLEITPLVTELESLPAQTSVTIPVTIRIKPDGGGAGGGGAGCTDCVVHMPIDTRYRCGQNFVTKTADVELQIICVPDTGCDFGSVDISRADFMTASSILSQSQLDCLMGKLDECQKARIRGYLRSGDFGSVDGPFGFGISDFCGCGPTERLPQLFNTACQYLEALGFSSPSGCNYAGGAGPGSTTLPLPPTGVPVNFGTFSWVAATIPGPCNGGAGGGSGESGGSGGGGTNGVCAKIKLELSQDMVLTRTAFRGRLVIENAGGTITGVQLNLDFRDAANQSVGTLFGINGPTLSGLTATDGTGVIAAQSTGSAEYLFVPTFAAASNAPTAYYIGGTLRFIEEGQEVIVPLLAASITVFPEAQLQLDYFQQRDVFADDPFTPELEPSEPFALGLLVRNTGAGIARGLQLQSGQPQIIENEKGLLNEFKLLGVEVQGQPQTASFQVSFGDIYPNQSALALWRMSSELQGKFLSFDASFEHLNELGGLDLSLIRSVVVHPLIHLVRADRPGDDSLPDLLVNDLPDPNDLPDAVFLSNGSTGAVSVVTAASVDGPVQTNDLQIQLTAAVQAGWVYLRLTNPGPDFRLVSAQRSDGKIIRLGDNIWTTDRSFPSSQPGALREDLLHLFDHNSTGSYTLNFAPIVTDTNAPTSAVTALPPLNSPTFSVSWTGDDGSGSGIAHFDIYVSVNNGPFTNWLANTTLNSAIFSGTAGLTYGFYSVATDLSGNEEIAPAGADTTTTASAAANTPPSIVPVGDLIIAEGSQFTFTPTVLDSDVPVQTLSYTLPGAPPGALLEPTTGFVRWQTGEAQGGTTNVFTLVVADNGLPSLSATQTFRVIVTELNSAPTFANIGAEIEATELTPLAFTVAATDADLPANQLTWSLAPGAPAGMTINSANGLLTWTPAESDGPGEFAVTVTVTDNGLPNQSATRLLRVIVREANQPPVLAAILPQATLVQTTLLVTNTATDPDLPAQKFFFSLAPGAPRGAGINRTNGIFSWTPSSAYALTTNSVTVRVTDDGVPALTTSQTFTVVVGDYLEARIGSGFALSGQSNAAPVVIYSTVPATNVTFTFQVHSSRLTNFSLLPPVPPLAAAILTPLGSNQFQVQLRTLPGQTMVGEQSFATLRFDAPTNRPSAFVPFESFTVTALQANGQPVPRSLGAKTRIICLDRESLLELVLQTNRADLLVYGRGAAYTVEAAPTLQPPVTYTRFAAGTVTNYTLTIPIIATNTMQFFRAVEGAFRFRTIGVNSLSREVSLTLDVLAGRTYELQWSTNLAHWISFRTNTAVSNQLQVTDQPPPNANSRLYRALER